MRVSQCGSENLKVFMNGTIAQALFASVPSGQHPGMIDVAFYVRLGKLLPFEWPEIFFEAEYLGLGGNSCPSRISSFQIVVIPVQQVANSDCCGFVSLARNREHCQFSRSNGLDASATAFSRHFPTLGIAPHDFPDAVGSKS